MRICSVATNTYRILHGKCARTVFTQELVKYQKSNQWAERVEISDTNQRFLFILYVLRLSLNDPCMNNSVKDTPTVQASYFREQPTSSPGRLRQPRSQGSSFVFASMAFFFGSFCFDCSSQLKRITCNTCVQFVFFACQKYSSNSFTSALLLSSVFLFPWYSTYSSAEEPLAFHFSFSKKNRESFKVNVGIIIAKNSFLATPRNGLCAKRRQSALNENFDTSHTSKNIIRGFWLDVLFFSHVKKAICAIWLVCIGLLTKIYLAAFQ